MDKTTKITSYKDLIVWQKSIDFVSYIYGITSQFPSVEKFNLTKTDKDFAYIEGYFNNKKQYLKVEYNRYYEALLSIYSYFTDYSTYKRSSVVNCFKRNGAILDVFKVYHDSGWYSHLYRVGYNPLIDKYSCLYKYKQEG